MAENIFETFSGLNSQDENDVNNFKSDSQSSANLMANPLNDELSDDENNFDDERVIRENVFLSSGDESCFSDIEGDKTTCFDIDNDLNAEESSNTGEKRKNNEPNKLTRKRLCNPKNWKRNVTKMAVNLGQEYTSPATQKIVPSRSMQRTCGPGCKLKCEEKVSELTRTAFFTEFWKIADHSRKFDFILRHVIENCVDRNIDKMSRRKYTRKYTINERDKNITVCKTMFLNTLNISSQMVETAFKKIRTGESNLIDKRGTSEKRPRAVEEDKTESVKEHINSFPSVESHYVRKDSNRKYLEESLSLSRMFKMYVVWTMENNKPIATKHHYYDIFNTQFNIGFFKPKKDQCDICEGYKNATDKEKLENKYKAHTENKNQARNFKETDKNFAKQTKSSSNMIIFDFQKVLSTPKTEASSLYYKRKLSVFNFTVYDVINHEAYCCLWSENDAKKGSNEVASCLLNYIDKKVSTGVKDFFLWSDNCGGQNRNKHVFSMYLYASSKYNINIKHSFLEVGHTQNEGDSVHATIEKHARGRKIFNLSEWSNIIESAKFDMIFDFKDLSAQMNWQQTVQNKNKLKTVPLPISKLKQVSASHENPNQLLYKTSFESDFKILVTRKEKNHINVKKYLLKTAYTSCQGLSTAKLKDLKTLCKTNIIPPQYHEYYSSFSERNSITDQQNMSDEED